MTTRWKPTNRKKKRGQSLIFPLSFLCSEGVRGEGLVDGVWQPLIRPGLPWERWWGGVTIYGRYFSSFWKRSEHFATDRRGDTSVIDLQQAFHYRGFKISESQRRSRERGTFANMKEECKHTLLICMKEMIQHVHTLMSLMPSSLFTVHAFNPV